MLLTYGLVAHVGYQVDEGIRRPAVGMGVESEDHGCEDLRPNGGRLKPVLQPADSADPRWSTAFRRNRLASPGRLKPVLQPRNPCVPAGIVASEDVHDSGQETRAQTWPHHVTDKSHEDLMYFGLQIRQLISISG